MPRPKPHYRLVVNNLETREQLKIKLVDLPFSSGRTFRLRINGQWARKVPAASKTTALRQLRAWWVAH